MNDCAMSSNEKQTDSQLALSRVIEEKRQLDERIIKLCTFLNNEEKVNKLPWTQVDLMQQQRDIMLDYSDKLNRRILLWDYTK